VSKYLEKILIDAKTTMFQKFVIAVGPHCPMYRFCISRAKRTGFQSLFIRRSRNGYSAAPAGRMSCTGNSLNHLAKGKEHREKIIFFLFHY
jgi:hypothetical protein